MFYDFDLFREMLKILCDLDTQARTHTEPNVKIFKLFRDSNSGSAKSVEELMNELFGNSSCKKANKHDSFRRGKRISNEDFNKYRLNYPGRSKFSVIVDKENYD